MIDEALRIYGTQAKAAEALGVSQATVARKRGAAA
jgi:DNA-binding transcriptional regulator YdaS (Cro superfamily)